MLAYTQLNKYPPCLAEQQGQFRGHVTCTVAQGPFPLSEGPHTWLIFCCCLLESLNNPRTWGPSFSFLAGLREEGARRGVAGNHYCVSVPCRRLLPGRNGWEYWLCVATSSDFSEGSWISGVLMWNPLIFKYSLKHFLNTGWEH